MSVRSYAPTPKHVAFMGDMKAVFKKRGDDQTAMEMLALASQLVGNLVALQDQRTVTPAMAMQVVASNIEVGNQTVIDGLLDSKGSA